MKEITLPSGAILKIGLAPFADSIELFQVLGEEMKKVEIHFTTEIDHELMKNLLCTAIASKPLEAAVWKCLAKCLYGGIRLTKDTFETEEARQDYFAVFYEVVVANVIPFTKNLSAGLLPLMQMMQAIPKPK